MLWCGTPTHFLPYLSSLLSSPTPHPNTLPTHPIHSTTLLNTPTHFSTPSSTLPPTSFPSSPYYSPTHQHTSLHLSPHLPSPSQSVAKLPYDEVSGKPITHCCHESCFFHGKDILKLKHSGMTNQDFKMLVCRYLKGLLECIDFYWMLHTGSG